MNEKLKCRLMCQTTPDGRYVIVIDDGTPMNEEFSSVCDTPLEAWRGAESNIKFMRRYATYCEDELNELDNFSYQIHYALHDEILLLNQKRVEEAELQFMFDDLMRQ